MCVLKKIHPQSECAIPFFFLYRDVEGNFLNSFLGLKKMGVTTEYHTFSKLPPKRFLDTCGGKQVSKSLPGYRPHQNMDISHFDISPKFTSSDDMTFTENSTWICAHVRSSQA